MSSIQSLLTPTACCPLIVCRDLTPPPIDFFSSTCLVLVSAFNDSTFSVRFSVLGMFPWPRILHSPRPTGRGALSLERDTCMVLFSYLGPPRVLPHTVNDAYTTLPKFVFTSSGCTRTILAQWFLQPSQQAHIPPPRSLPPPPPWWGASDCPSSFWLWL